ncbi:MAG TPA: glycosyltransferase family 39 protein, partial [Anaerolineae bacterium]
MWLQYEHAPLSHWLNGMLLFTEPTLPYVTELPDWSAGRDPITLSRQLLWPEGYTAHLDRTLLLARLPILLTGLFLGAALARWAKMGAGWLSQSAVMVLFAFSPNLLASFALATTDAPLTAVYLGAVFALWSYWQSPSWERWLLAAAMLGLAISAKITALLLLPVTLLLCYSRWQRGQPWWRPGLVWLSLLPVAGLVLWTLYGFEWRSMAGLPFTV